ncbi:phage tail assembly protein [Pseudomonas sp. SJZ131]|uniref:phage tail assembly protein n=1 Tax=Pseudomonas sp. SJZ131 TaxID=2572895 RepID=UPI00119BC33F|nr:phage tail assembly protein [Pseudomonas sp. SJZ131]TWD49504.1 tail assembly chaperone E/41/14-like protein [Pseudomonas sp. SJZ131]
MTQAIKKMPDWLVLTGEHAVVTLSRPSEANGVKVEKVTLRAPTLRQELAADAAVQGDAEQRELLLFAGLAEMGIKDIEGLKLVDYHRLQAGYEQLVPQFSDAKEQAAWLSVTPDNALVTLLCPVEINGVMVDKLVMRSPTVLDVRAANRESGGDEVRREVVLFANLTGVNVGELEGLKLVDYYRLQAGYFRLVRDDGV